MSVCEICDAKVKRASVCKQCGVKFCDKHGDKKKKLCEDCLEFIEDDVKIEDYEDLGLIEGD
jgi:hypothetical protein